MSGHVQGNGGACWVEVKFAQSLKSPLGETNKQINNLRLCPLGDFQPVWEGLVIWWGSQLKVCFLMKMWRNWIPPTLLVVTDNGPTTLENYVATSYNTKPATTIQPSNCTPGHLSQRNEILYSHKNL